MRDLHGFECVFVSETNSGLIPSSLTMNKQKRIAKLKQEGFKAIEERNPDKLLKIVQEIKRLSKL